MTQICQWPPAEAMLVGAKVCDLTEDLLWFVCGLYVGILMSSLTSIREDVKMQRL